MVGYMKPLDYVSIPDFGNPFSCTEENGGEDAQVLGSHRADIARANPDQYSSLSCLLLTEIGR